MSGRRQLREPAAVAVGIIAPPERNLLPRRKVGGGDPPIVLSLSRCGIHESSVTSAWNQ
jgi:hypothetical protein